MVFTPTVSEAAVEPMDWAIEPKNESKLPLVFHQNGLSKAYCPWEHTCWVWAHVGDPGVQFGETPSWPFGRHPLAWEETGGGL